MPLTHDWSTYISLKYPPRDKGLLTIGFPEGLIKPEGNPVDQPAEERQSQGENSDHWLSNTAAGPAEKWHVYEKLYEILWDTRIW